MSIDMPDWLQAAGAAVNAELRAARHCWAHSTDAGGDVNVPAAYVWHTAIGNEVPLCVACCAAWRADAAIGVCEQPTCIEALTS